MELVFSVRVDSSRSTIAMGGSRSRLMVDDMSGLVPVAAAGSAIMLVVGMVRLYCCVCLIGA